MCGPGDDSETAHGAMLAAEHWMFDVLWLLWDGFIPFFVIWVWGVAGQFHHRDTRNQKPLWNGGGIGKQAFQQGWPD